MNFNLYLDERAAKRLDAVARKTRTPRNALIRRAVGAWLDRQEAVWPDEVLKLIPDPDLAPFESHRSELREPSDDPLGIIGIAIPKEAGRPRRRSKTK